MSTTFHDTPPPWFESVKDLAPGAKRRLGDGFIASFNGKAYHRYDFREKSSEVYEPQLTLPQKLAIMAQLAVAKDVAIQSHEPPGPAMPNPQDWPVEARVWLHKAHFDNDDIFNLGAYWNPVMRRVVIPYRTFDGRQSWVARYIPTGMGGYHDKGPKYLTPFGGYRGGGAMFVANKVRCFSIPRRSKYIVLTEDILSAARVAMDTHFDALSVMGTSLDRDTIIEVATSYDGVAIWLDPDRYGRIGARKIESEFSRLDKPTRRVDSSMDPKLYSGPNLHYTMSVVEGYLESLHGRL